MTTKQRNVQLDIVRIVACLLVLFMHTTPARYATSSYSLLLSIQSYFTMPCIAMLFMASGALLLNRKPEPFGMFMKRRFSRILWPLLIWTLIYMAGNVVVFGASVALIDFLSIPFQVQGHGIMWFLYTMGGLYLLTPILRVWLASASRRQIEFYLCLWLVTTAYPIVKIFTEVSEGPEGMLYYFSGFAGFYLLGYYLEHYRVRFAVWKLAVIGCVCVASPVACKLFAVNVDFYSLFWYLSIFSVGMGVIYWQLIGYITVNNASVKRFLGVMSGLTFGVYLSHMLMMRYIFEPSPLSDIVFGTVGGYIPFVIVEFLLVASTSFLLVWLLSYLPGADHFIGYTSRK